MSELTQLTPWRRFRVFLFGKVMGWVFATLVAVTFAQPTFDHLGEYWVRVVGGPITGVFDGTLVATWVFLPSLLLIPAHPLRPNWFTGTVTLIGLAGWYLSGAVSVIVSLCWASC